MSPGGEIMGYHEACSVDDLFEGDMMGVKINGYELVILNVEGDIKAYYGLCPHALGRLGEEGIFDDGRLVCGVHLWEFDAKTGASINPCGAKLPSFPVHIEDGKIYVELPDIPVRDWVKNNLNFDTR